jgi:LytS/YehU family sensor histidine kinase
MKLKYIIDPRLLKYIALFYTFTVLIGLIRKVYLKSTGLFYKTISWFGMFTYDIILDWLIVIVFMILMSRLIKRMFERKLSWTRIILVHLFFSFFMGYFIFFISGLIVVLINGSPLISLLDNLSLNHFMSVVHLNFLVYFSMIGIITVYFYTNKIKNIEIQKSQLETQLATTKLNILKSQLHPHFMFNTLNSISSLMEVDVERSQNLIADFGDLFREFIAYNETHMIPLKKSLEFLDKYMDIISVRFSDHLTFTKTIEKGVEDYLVPSLLMQPIVENAIKHGYGYTITELEIKLSVYKIENNLTIEIENNGAPLDASFNVLLKKGTGLEMTHERLKTLYGKNFIFILENNGKGSVVSKIKFPIE